METYECKSNYWKANIEYLEREHSCYKFDQTIWYVHSFETIRSNTFVVRLGLALIFLGIGHLILSNTVV